LSLMGTSGQGRVAAVSEIGYSTMAKLGEASSSGGHVRDMLRW
jgi:hypothetical protein